MLSFWVFRLAYLPFWLIFLLFSYRWTRKLTDFRGAVFTLLYALFPSATVMICIGRGGYTVLLALDDPPALSVPSALLAGGGEVQAAEVFFSGLVGGLIFWNDFLGVPYIILALLLIFWPWKKGCSARWGRWGSSVFFGLPAVLGLEPGLPVGEPEGHGGPFRGEDLGGAHRPGLEDVHRVFPLPPGIRRLRDPGISLAEGGCTGGVALVVTGYALWRTIFIRDSRRKSLVWMLLFALMVIGLFLLGQQPGVPRYLLPFYSVFPTPAGILLWDLHRRIRWLAWGLLPFLILLSVHDVFLLYTARSEDLRLPVSSLIRFMQEQGVRLLTRIPVTDTPSLLRPGKRLFSPIPPVSGSPIIWSG